MRPVFVACAVLGVLAFPGMASGAGPVQLSKIYFDVPGSDTPGKLNQEYVVLCNEGNESVALEGWKLSDPDGHVYEFKVFSLKGGKCVSVHTGPGTDGPQHVYQDAGEYIWNNDGDRATLRKANGDRADRCRYTSSADSPHEC